MTKTNHNETEAELFQRLQREHLKRIAKLRWKNVSKEDRKAHSKMMNERKKKKKIKSNK